MLDGTTQTGFTGNPIIELDGSTAGAVNGLTITAGSSTIRGLVINRFGTSGIYIMTNGSNLVAGNYLGTDVTGTTVVGFGNGSDGIEILSPNNIIG